ncbi:Protein outspread [Apis cerana cerana]|uniref:Protein outspread n=1 Tax=Apis cerana cerana TaxID=94128 RepID=A0A2A3EQX8_APICC|nr:Protein outspread [Apis cerana cerana]
MKVASFQSKLLHYAQNIYHNAIDYTMINDTSIPKNIDKKYSFMRKRGGRHEVRLVNYANKNPAYLTVDRARSTRRRPWRTARRAISVANFRNFQQRRMFYANFNPETVPQARIDMTRVLEVAAAEDITGHPYSLAITSPEGVTFVKGTCREETRWWADVLQVYSRNKGRHKRNATFPGGQTTILQVTPTIRILTYRNIYILTGNTPNPPRPRFNSCRSEPRSNTWISETSVPADLCASVFSSTPSLVTNSVVTTTSNTSMSNGNVVENSNDHRVTANVSPLRTSTPLENGGSTYITSVPSTSTMNGSVSSTVYTTTSTSTTVSSVNSLTEKPPIVPNEGRSSYKDQPASSASPPTRDKLRAEDKARRRMNQHGERTGTACSGEKLGIVRLVECEVIRRMLGNWSFER